MPKMKFTIDEMLDLMYADPIAFMEELLGEYYWSKQRDVMNYVINGPSKKTAVRAGNGPGKSFIAVRTGLLFLLMNPNAVVIVTATKEATLKTVFFRELKMALKKDAERYGLFKKGKVTHLRFALTETGYIEGKVATTTENILGQHNDDLLVIVDEASGVSSEVLSGVGSFLTGHNNRLLMIGNPTKNTGDFYEAFQPALSHLYNTMHISTLDLPIFTDEYCPPALERAFGGQRDFVADTKARFGENSAEYMWKILGEFPDQSDRSVVSKVKLEAAYRRNLAWNDEKIAAGPFKIAVDVAQHGDDSTVVVGRAGPKCIILGKWADRDLMHSCGQVIRFAKEFHKMLKEHYPDLLAHEISIVADEVGMGQGFVSRLKEVCRENSLGFVIEPFSGAEKPAKWENKGEYPNRRSEAWFEFAENVDEFDLERDAELTAELLGVEYDFDSQGRRVVERKAVTKKRNGSSPDTADAVLMAFAPAKNYSWSLGSWTL